MSFGGRIWKLISSGVAIRGIAYVKTIGPMETNFDLSETFMFLTTGWAVGF